MHPHKPSDLLSMFFRNNLDRILSPIDQSVPLPRARVTELREQFIDQGSKAPEPKKPMYEAAIAVCNAVSAAITTPQPFGCGRYCERKQTRLSFSYAYSRLSY